MPVLSVRVTEEEEAIIKNYAKSKNNSISQMIKKIILEKIESEYDFQVCNEYLVEKEKDALELIPFKEAIKEWDIK